MRGECWHYEVRNLVSGKKVGVAKLMPNVWERKDKVLYICKHVSINMFFFLEDELEML